MYIYHRKYTDLVDVFKLTGFRSDREIRRHSHIVFTIGAKGSKTTFKVVTSLANCSYLGIRYSQQPCVLDTPLLKSSVLFRKSLCTHVTSGMYPPGDDASKLCTSSAMELDSKRFMSMAANVVGIIWVLGIGPKLGRTSRILKEMASLSLLDQ